MTHCGHKEGRTPAAQQAPAVRGVLSFRSKAREGPGSEPARVHRASRRPAAAWPVVASAQQDGRMRRIGVLMSGAEADTELQARVKAFRQTLEQYGWSEGRNIHMDIRFSAIRSDEYKGRAIEAGG